MKKPFEPINQHTLPRMFLDRFTNHQGLIWRYDKVEEVFTHQPRSPKTVSRRKNAYTVMDEGGNDYKIEEYFSRIERSMAPLYKKIENSDPWDLTDEEIGHIFDHSILLMLRTDRVIDIASEIAEDPETQNDVRRKGEQFGMREVVVKNFLDKCNQEKGFAYAVAIEPLQEQRRKLFRENFDLIFSTIDHDMPLIVNDTYMCIEPISPFAGCDAQQIDWKTLNARLHFPLSSKRCLSLTPKGADRRGRHSDFMVEVRSQSLADTKIINRTSYKLAQRYLYTSEKGALPMD